MNKLKSKLTAGVITFLLVVLLMAVGPTKAFVLNLNIQNSFPLAEEPVNFVTSIEIEQGENLNIKNFTLKLTGEKNIECVFLPNGTLLTNCSGIQIKQIESSEFQSGYGFLPGALKYNITISPNTLPVGDYVSKFFVSTLESTFESSEKQITIIKEGIPVEKCSLRAEKGEIVIDGERFISSRNKLNLAVPESRALNGKGYITAQSGRKRISYKFTIDRAVRVNEDRILIYTSGILKQNKKEKAESAAILFDTNSLKIDVAGDSLSIQNMDVNFAKC